MTSSVVERDSSSLADSLLRMTVGTRGEEKVPGTVLSRPEMQKVGPDIAFGLISMAKCLAPQAPQLPGAYVLAQQEIKSRRCLNGERHVFHVKPY